MAGFLLYKMVWIQNIKKEVKVMVIIITAVLFVLLSIAE